MTGIVKRTFSFIFSDLGGWVSGEQGLTPLTLTSTSEMAPTCIWPVLGDIKESSALFHVIVACLSTLKSLSETYTVFKNELELALITPVPGGGVSLKEGKLAKC